jgi:DNA-binding LacI/PurR family transcriptional regulator
VATDSSARRVTIADIATATGVSVATVSKVLNDRPDVAPATRALVKSAMAQQKYVKTSRTQNSDSRKAQRAGLIDIIFNDAGSLWAAEMIRGVEATARSARASVVVSVLDSDTRKGERWLEDVAARGSLGFILALSQLSNSDLHRIANLGVPMILVDPVGDFESDLPSFGAGNWGGGVAATQHLIDLGHRRIGTITGPMRYLCSQARLAGYRAALERSGIVPDPALVQQGDFHYASAVAGASALLDLADPPTAIFAANDEQALGVYAAVQQRRLRVPDDLSVVGFDDVPMSQWILPPLTTARQPILELAELAARAILGQANGNSPVPKGRTELPTTLVVRSSTAPPPARPKR